MVYVLRHNIQYKIVLNIRGHDTLLKRNICSLFVINKKDSKNQKEADRITKNSSSNI